MNETLREFLAAQGPLGEELVRKGGGLDYFTDILDAHVIRGTCPTCGGSRKCRRCDGKGKWVYELELAMIDCDDCGGSGDCPDCADAPVWVIAPEAWEAFRAAWRKWRKERQQIDVEHAALIDVLQALLPGARRAKEVVTVDSDTMFIDLPVDYDRMVELRGGADIAILHNEQEKEHE